MNKHRTRLNYTGIHSEGKIKVRGKVAFKTQETSWLNTNLPCIALISIDSAFHEGLNGDIKIGAFLSIIKQHTRGPVSILLADTAHIETQKLKYKSHAFEECFRSTNFLIKRYSSYFDGCNILYWSSFNLQNEHFATFYAQVEDLAKSDPLFQRLLEKDAEAAYTEKRREEFPNQIEFLEKTKADILAQSACILILSKEGYRYQFYPGAPYSSIQYINDRLLPTEKQVQWIDVFLSIEKKTVLEEERVFDQGQDLVLA